MTFIKKCLLLCGIILFVFGTSFSQSFRPLEKPADFKDLYELKTNAIKLLDTRPRRIVSTHGYSNDSSYTAEELVFEYLDEDRIRIVKKKRTGKNVSETEKIYVGNSLYIREGKSSWQKFDRGNLEVPLTEEKIRDSSTCLVRELSVLLDYEGNAPARKFKEIAFSNGEHGIVQTITNTSIGLDGLLLREQIEKRYFSGGRIEHLTPLMISPVIYEAITTYEYDPKIKIEAPIN